MMRKRISDAETTPVRVVIVVAGVIVTRATSAVDRGPLTVAESLGVPPGFSVGPTMMTPSAGGQAR